MGLGTNSGLAEPSTSSSLPVTQLAAGAARYTAAAAMSSGAPFRRMAVRWIMVWRMLGSMLDSQLPTTRSLPRRGGWRSPCPGSRAAAISLVVATGLPWWSRGPTGPGEHCGRPWWGWEMEAPGRSRRWGRGRSIERGEDIEAEGCLQLLDRGVQKRMGLGPAGIVDHHVEPTELTDCPGAARRAREVVHVARQDQGPLPTRRLRRPPPRGHLRSGTSGRRRLRRLRRRLRSPLRSPCPPR